MHSPISHPIRMPIHGKYQQHNPIVKSFGNSIVAIHFSMRIRLKEEGKNCNTEIRLVMITKTGSGYHVKLNLLTNRKTNYTHVCTLNIVQGKKNKSK